MKTEVIKAGEWIVREGETPHFNIHKLIQGRVSVYSGEKKIREVEIKEGMKPIMLGITAVLGDEHKHTASVRTESEAVVEKVSVDFISRMLKYEVTDDMKSAIAVMTKAIARGNEITRRLNEFYNLPPVDLEIPQDLDSATVDILSEIKRLYKVVVEDVASLAPLFPHKATKPQRE